jgi:hypothetical protein
MIPALEKPGFVGRFGKTWSRLRRTEIRCGLCRTLFVAAFGVALLAAADYVWEMPWSVRAVGLAAVGCLTLIVAVHGMVAPVRWWSRPRTAVEIERRFPQLGQRIRTLVQFAGRKEAAVAREGALPTLVAALEEDTDAQTGPLDLGVLVPRRKLTLTALVAAVPVVLLLAAASLDWEWRLAVGRALLDDSPYTRLSVSPGDARVDQDSDVTISVDVEGRVPQRVAVYCRPAERPGADWEERELTAEEQGHADTAPPCRTTRIERLQEPIEYWAVAGQIESPTYRISVRLPVAIRKFEADLVPPAYTAIKPSTVPGGDLDVVEGTQVRFRVQLDRPVAEARLILSDPGSAPPTGASASAAALPMETQGNSLTAQLGFTDEKYYRIAVRAADGTSLAENRYHVRVRKDQPPRVSFLEPDEALEVHPIAEVLAKIRVDDDFGLCRAGIVFRVGGGEERTLILKDFKKPQPKTQDGAPANLTQATVEELLRLEQFGLGQTDSITYYAFAEDNYPGGPKRTETDLRFIDIRPFKRVYKIGGT